MGRLIMPGLKAEFGTPFLQDGKGICPVTLQVTSWWRLIWYVLRKDFEVKWYQWPKAIFLVAKWSVIKWMEDRWPVRTSSAS